MFVHSNVGTPGLRTSVRICRPAPLLEEQGFEVYLMCGCDGVGRGNRKSIVRVVFGDPCAGSP
jgi:hypothetical protein